MREGPLVSDPSKLLETRISRDPQRNQNLNICACFLYVLVISPEQKKTSFLTFMSFSSWFSSPCASDAEVMTVCAACSAVPNSLAESIAESHCLGRRLRLIAQPTGFYPTLQRYRPATCCHNSKLDQQHEDITRKKVCGIFQRASARMGLAICWTLLDKFGKVPIPW